MTYLFFHGHVPVAWKILEFFAFFLLLLRSSARSVSIIWVALVACWGQCLQWHKASCPAKKQKTGQTAKDTDGLANEKPCFLAMQHPGVNTARGGCDDLRLKLHYSYTQTSWNILCPEPSPHQRGQRGLWAPYWHGTLLVLLEQVMFTPGKQHANQQNISLYLLSWPAKTHPWPETAEEREVCRMLMSAKQRTDTVLQDGKAQSWTQGYQEFPVVTVAHKASSWEHTSNDRRHSTSRTPGEDSCRDGHGTVRISSQKIINAGRSSGYSLRRKQYVPVEEMRVIIDEGDYF